MTKQELLTKVQNKVGFHSIIKDELAPDHIADDPIEKRFLYINHTNADGTMGKTFVYYLCDAENDVASFYNMEAEALDAKEPPADQKKLNALETYLESNFDAFRTLWLDPARNFAEAETFKLNAGKLDRKKVLVFKRGKNPISHLEIVG